MSKFILLLFSVLIFSSCAKTDQEEIDSAIREAKYYLSVDDCSAALSVLDGVGFQNDDAFYIGVYASAQACGADYTELDTVFGNLANIGSSNGALFASLAAFSSSNETQADSAVYLAIQSAIDTLIFAGGVSSPDAAVRITTFGARKGADLNNQALYLLLVQLGKYLAYYGAADTTSGAKGVNGNTCLADYTDVTAIGYIVANTADTCAGAGNSNADLASGNADYVKRLCEGWVLYTNFTDLMSNITVSTNTSTGNLGGIAALFDSIYQIAEAADSNVTTYKTIRSQVACEAAAAADDLGIGVRLQRVYALILEGFYI